MEKTCAISTCNGSFEPNRIGRPRQYCSIRCRRVAERIAKGRKYEAFIEAVNAAMKGNT